MKFVTISFLTTLIILLTGCSDYWTIQRSENFINEKNKPKKMICLSPMISFQVKDKNNDIQTLQKLSSKLEKSLTRYARKNDIQLDIRKLDSNSSQAFYDKLLPLKNHIVENSFNNYSYVNSGGLLKENKLSKSVYVYAPKISYEFNSYSKEFGTKYFSYIKVVIGTESFNFYHILVDTDLSETVFSERKTINHKFNQDLADQVIYDSFATISKELEM